MKCLLVASCLLAVAAANPGLLAPYHAHGLAIAPAVHAYAAPAVTSSQYHAQDELGQYSYGYAGGPSAKHEVKTFDGVTRGGYSYIDANGILQTVNYISDPINGFRVAATNLPVAPAPEAAAPVAVSVAAPLPVVDTPEVAAAKATHLAAVNEAKIRAAAPAVVSVVADAPAAVASSPVVVAPVAAPVSVAHAPVAYAHAHPAIHAFAAAPAVVSSQYHAQDELGQYSYGYAGGPSAKHETKTFDGVTRGGYSYIDANGLLQTVHYVSDPVHGFRVAATNLPVAPASAAGVVPQNVYLQDAPDVAIAKAAHFAAHAEAKARL